MMYYQYFKTFLISLKAEGHVVRKYFCALLQTYVLCLYTIDYSYYYDLFDSYSIFTNSKKKVAFILLASYYNKTRFKHKQHRNNKVGLILFHLILAVKSSIGV